MFRLRRQLDQRRVLEVREQLERAVEVVAGSGRALRRKPNELDDALGVGLVGDEVELSVDGIVQLRAPIEDRPGHDGRPQRDLGLERRPRFDDRRVAG
ncbi:MAG: hypothetical protein H0X16_05990 [Chloroflexi bacterium]|nr:hypothetical protein [Chloroflexota bacterium]